MATQILMPALSPTMEEGKLAKWHVKEGDKVSSGDILAEIETDKATMEFEAIDEGIIGKILIAEGAEGVKVNTPIAVLLEEGEDASAADAVAAPKAAAPAAATPAPTATPVAPVAAPAPAPVAVPTAGRIYASPLARRIAALKNIDLSSVRGTGPRGRIVQADVEAAASNPVSKAAAPVATAAAPSVGALPDAKLFYKPEDYDELPNDGMRKSIAKRLTTAASQIPHVAITIDCKLDALLKVRTALNAAAPKDGGYKLSVNDFVIKAVAQALIAVPEVNASWTDAATLRHKHADVGVAVALPTGLITPIVPHAETKGLKAISEEVKSLVARAKDRKLKPSEYEGGTFSVSNLGMFGVKQFSSIINPPQGAILSVGAGEERPVVEDGKIVVATVMSVTLALDHRIADGAAGARFLQVFKQYIEQPATMLL
ncbi:MAG: pyruvate dehydrogenase complex dihydrolipoamide acetyltransferase [Rhizomicrobium sp.]